MLGSKIKREAIDVPESCREDLDFIARHYKVSLGDAVRLAAGSERYILAELARGGRILIEKCDGTLREVDFAERVE